MLIKDCIENLIARNKETQTFIELNLKNSDADKGILDYCTYLKQSLYNSTLSLPFANILQFCSDPQLCDQFEWIDIGKLLDSFFKLNEHCVNIYIDGANFAE